MRNYFLQTILLAILVLAMLLGLSLLPENQSLGDLSLKKMDILQDIRQSVPISDSIVLDPALPDTLATVISDSTNLIKSDTMLVTPVIIPLKDSSEFGQIIEDYTAGQQGMHSFFRAVDSIKNGGTVRIAWYGDSFVEGDILIGDLRDTLQTLWGGKGVGFVPITSEVAQFKRSIKHHFKGWETYSVIKKSETRPNLGINGYAYRPSPEANVHYEGLDYFKNTRRWGKFRLFYSTETPTSMVWQNKDDQPNLLTLVAKPGIQTWEWERSGSIRAFAIRFPEPSPTFVAYGASLEDGPGVYMDNFSIRGNSGGPLKLLKPEVIKQFDRVQQYDLIILQVGLNAVTNSLNNIKWYQAELDRTFAHLRVCFPTHPILIIGVADRGGKIGTELATMRGVPAIVNMQRDMARKHGFMFYDLYHAMGGSGSMIRLAYQKPRLANTDYTHLTHEGGKYMSRIFVNLFTQEQNLYKSKKSVN